MNLILECITTKYAKSNGRAGRKQFWLFLVAYFFTMMVVGALDVVLGTYDVFNSLGLLGVVFWLSMVIPYIAVSIRRLHDTNRSGWWFLIGFIPVIGPIWFLVLMVLAGTGGDNRFGPPPFTKLTFPPPQ